MEGDNQAIFYEKRIDLDICAKGSRMLVGDINGDGRLEMVFVQPDKGIDDRYFPHSVVCATAFTADGEMLWQTGTPDPDAEYVPTDLPAQIYDLDNDGNNEFLCIIDGEFCEFDGLSGSLKRKWQLPSPDAHDSFLIADLEGRGYAQNIILKNRYHQMWAMDSNFNLMWTQKGNIGHFPWPYDIDNDGKDEVITGNSLYDDEGRLIWSNPVSGHTKALYICDLDRNPDTPASIVTGGEKLCAYASDGSLIWEVEGILNVTSILPGNFIPQNALVQFAVLAEYEGVPSLLLVDNRGRVLCSEPALYKNGCTLNTLCNFGGKNGEYILFYPANGQPASIYNHTLEQLYVLPFNGSVTVADVTGSGDDDIFVFGNERVEIYSVVEHSLQDAALPYTRPQSKALYNSSIFSVGEGDTTAYQIGYATGDFSHDALASWATRCILGTEAGVDSVISRADFIVLLVDALNLHAYERDNFSDVSPTAYYSQAAGIAKKLGICEGALGKFNPTSPMTAEAAVEMIKRTGHECFLMSEGELTRRSAAKIMLELLKAE